MAELPFLRPQWLLVSVPLAALWILLALRERRARRWEDLVDAHLRDAVLSGDSDARRWLLLGLLGVAWLLLVAALAGPVWQQEARPVYRIEQARVLLLDLSPSMDRVDAGSSRLQRARFEAMDLLRAADEGQLALIAYGAEPFLIAPLTSDAEILLEQVSVLAPDLLPVSGVRRTDLAIDMAAALLRRSGAVGGDVILISDVLEPGNPRSDAGAQAVLAAAERLRAMGHRLSVLAVSGAGPFGELAQAGGGILVGARADDLDTARLIALQTGGRRAAAGERVAEADQWRDEGVWLLLLLLPVAAAAFRRGWLGLLPLSLCLLPPPPAQALSWNDLWLRSDQQAWRALEQGGSVQAGQRFDEPSWRAAASYLAGDFAHALDELQGLQGSEAHYNRGNVLARLRRYADAVAEYDAALLLAPGHRDARHNRELLRTLLQAQPESPEAETLFADQGPEPTEDDAEGGTDGDGSAAGPKDDARNRDLVEAVAAGGVIAGAGGANGQSDIGARNAAGADPESAAGFGSTEDGPAVDMLTGGGQRRPTSADREPSLAADHGAHQPSLAKAGGESVETFDTGASAMMADSEQGPLDDAAGAASIDYLLRQVPDDPAGLLRERLMLQYMRRHGQLP
jgi:Ca-activated chloride channel family protein